MVDGAWRYNMIQYIDWKYVKVFASSKFVKSSYFWFIAVPLLYRYGAEIKQKYDIDLPVPISWEIFYYGSIIISLGLVIYHFFCPKIIKDFDNYSDFSASGRGVYQLESYFMQLFLDESKIKWDDLKSIINFYDYKVLYEEESYKHGRIVLVLEERMTNTKIHSIEDINTKEKYNRCLREYFNPNKRELLDGMEIFWFIYKIGLVSNKMSMMMSIAFIMLGLLLWLVVFLNNAYIVIIHSKII